MGSDSEIQEEREDIQNALKAMNWEERLEQARARRNELLAQRQSEQNASGEVKARHIFAGLSSERPDDSGKESSQAVLFPRMKKSPTEDSPSAVAPNLSEPKTPPKPVSQVAHRSGSSMVALIALGFGIGLGVGVSLYFAITLLGPKSAMPILTETRTLTVAPSSIKPDVTTADGTASAASPIQPTPIQTDPIVASAVDVDSAPDVDQVSPAPPSNITFLAAEVRTPEVLDVEHDPVREVALLNSPGSPEFIPVIPEPSDQPEPSIFRPQIGLSNVEDSPRMTLDSETDGRPLIAGAASPFELSSISPSDQTVDLASTSPPARLMATIDPSISPRGAVSDLTSLTGAYADEPSLSRDLETELKAALAMLDSEEALPAQPDLPDQPDLRLPGADGYTIRLSAPSTIPESEVESVVARLREAGISLGPIQRVNFKVTANQVRFFHPEDSATASIIAERVDAEARDFTSFRPSPEVGTMEVFVAGDGAPVAPRKASSAKKPSELDRIVNKLVNSLRRGDFR